MLERFVYDCRSNTEPACDNNDGRQLHACLSAVWSRLLRTLLGPVPFVAVNRKRENERGKVQSEWMLVMLHPTAALAAA